MQKLFILLLLTISINVIAQDFQENMKIPYIEVTGSAEKEVTPDEIYLGITLKEYLKDKKKVSLEESEKALLSVLASLKIDPKNLVVENVFGNTYLKKKKEDFVAFKRYRLKLSNTTAFDQLMDKLDEMQAQEVNVEEVKYSAMDELRIQVKSQALVAAKEKAKILLASVNQLVGKPLIIREMNNDYNYYPQQAYSNSRMMLTESGNAPQQDTNLDFKKIRVRFEILARFEIK